MKRLSQKMRDRRLAVADRIKKDMGHAVVRILPRDALEKGVKEFASNVEGLVDKVISGGWVGVGGGLADLGGWSCICGGPRESGALPLPPCPAQCSVLSGLSSPSPQASWGWSWWRTRTSWCRASSPTLSGGTAGWRRWSSPPSARHCCFPAAPRPPRRQGQQQQQQPRRRRRARRCQLPRCSEQRGRRAPTRSGRGSPGSGGPAHRAGRVGHHTGAGCLWAGVAGAGALGTPSAPEGGRFRRGLCRSMGGCCCLAEHSTN